MSTPTVHTPVDVPEGFFGEIAAQLETESAQEISETVIDVCTSRGILSPDLEDDPDDDLRAEELRTVFALLDAVTAAVASGVIVPHRIHVSDDMEPIMERAWDMFADAVADPSASRAGLSLLSGADIDVVTPS